MIGGVYHADFGIVTLALLVSVLVSAIPAIFVGILQWWLRRKETTTFHIKLPSKEVSIDVKNLSSQDLTSILDALKDKPDGRQTKS